MERRSTLIGKPITADALRQTRHSGQYFPPDRILEKRLRHFWARRGQAPTWSCHQDLFLPTTSRLSKTTSNAPLPIGRCAADRLPPPPNPPTRHTSPPPRER